MTTDNTRDPEGQEEAVEAPIPDTGNPAEEPSGQLDGNQRPDVGQTDTSDTTVERGKETDDAEKAKADPESIVNTTPAD